MSSQPFDYYKNKDVEYDFVLSASVNIGEISNEVLSEIISFIKNEDLLAMYFDKIALGRVYPKVEYLNGKLHFTFGISLVDVKERPTYKDLIENIINFILSLNKNIEGKDIKIKEEGIKVNIITENKNIFDNIDKTLVTENNLYFSRGNDIQRFSLTEDGVVEKYLNERLQQTFPFSKLGLTRECKTLASEGYTLTWNNISTDTLTEATIPSTNNENDTEIDISNPEQTKQDLQQNIKDVEEIQNLKDELDDKVANLMEEAIEVTEPFPSNEFSSEPVLYQDLDVETFNEELTAEQKAYINTYLGTLEEFVDAMLLLYNEVGDGISPLISVDDYVEELLNDNGIAEWSKELADMLGFDLKTEEKDDTLSYGDLEDLAKDIYEWFDSDIGTHFDEIKDNEEETYGDIMTILETKDQAQIQNFIDTIKEADIDDETAKKIKIATTSSLLDRLNSLLENSEIKTENKSKFHTADKVFEEFLKIAKEEAEEDGYTFKLSDLGLTKEDSAKFKNLLLQRDEIEDVSYDPQNNTYTVKVTGVETEEKPVDNNEDEK